LNWRFLPPHKEIMLVLALPMAALIAFLAIVN
jgi:hypothetical protein